MKPSPRRSRRLVLAGLAILPFAALFAKSASAAPVVVVTRSSSDPRWVTGTVSIPVAKTAAWSKLSAVGTWQALFTDIVSSKTRKHVGDHWELEVVSRILGGHAHDFLVDLSGTTVALQMAITGVDAHGTLSLSSSGAAETVARFDLYASTSGAIGWFVSEKSLREKQAALVRSYLDDLAKAFPT